MYRTDYLMISKLHPTTGTICYRTVMADEFGCYYIKLGKQLVDVTDKEEWFFHKGTEKKNLYELIK